MAAHSNDEDQEALSIVFELGGRLDLPEDFSVASLHLASPEELAQAASKAPLSPDLRPSLTGWTRASASTRTGTQIPADEELAGLLGLEAEEWIDADDDVLQNPYDSQVSLVREWAMSRRVRLG